MYYQRQLSRFHRQELGLLPPYSRPRGRPNHSHNQPSTQPQPQSQPQSVADIEGDQSIFASLKATKNKKSTPVHQNKRRRPAPPSGPQNHDQNHQNGLNNQQQPQSHNIPGNDPRGRLGGQNPQHPQH